MSEAVAAPSVRALAARKGIDIDRLARELGRETITRDDLEAGGRPAAAPAGPATTPAAPEAADWAASYWDVDHAAYGPVSEEKMSRFAQVAARNLAAAALIPAVTHHDSADISRIEAFREGLKPEAAARGVRLTALAFQLKALARCLLEFPRFNASLSPDGTTLVLKHYVHIGIAVDSPHGLMVPVIRDADRKGLWRIATEIADLAARARDRKIAPDEMGGASMSISALGGIGGEGFTPIINPPELAILGITRTRISPVWNGEAFQPRPLLPLDLTYDHRVINGAEAARFMRHYCQMLEDPESILL